MYKCKNCLHENQLENKNCSKCSIPLNETNIPVKKTFSLKLYNGKSYRLSGKPIVIGRNGLFSFLNDCYMSKIHAEIFLKNNVLIIIDKNSQNGVLVNGKKIKKETHLIRNDKIICGKTSFKII